jgi:hypothetical protein
MSLKSAQTAKIGKQFKIMRESLGLSEIQVSKKSTLMKSTSRQLNLVTMLFFQLGCLL